TTWLRWCGRCERHADARAEHEGLPRDRADGLASRARRLVRAGAWRARARPDDEHDCGWKAYAKAQKQKLDELTAKLAAVTAKLQELERRGPKTHRSERRKRGKKMP